MDNNEGRTGPMGGGPLWYPPQGNWAGGYAATNYHPGQYTTPNGGGPPPAAHAMTGEGAAWDNGGQEGGQSENMDIDVPGSRQRSQWVTAGKELPPGLPVSVVSYNILSDFTIYPESFVGVDPAHLDNERRLRGLLKKIDEHIKPINPEIQETVWLGPERPIFCLQEVSSEQAKGIEPHFASHNYAFLYTHYCQTRREGVYKMGVAIAYPMDLYWRLEFMEKRIAEAKSWVEVENVENTKWWWYKDAQERQNIAIGVRLEPVDWHPAVREHPHKVPFVVATYHMPCAFSTYPIMTLHASLVMEVVHEWAAGGEYILAGDFNFTPAQPAYPLVTIGQFPESSDQEGFADLKSIGDRWKHNYATTFMNSAYSLSHPRYQETQLTCWANDESGPFCDTVDYIFLKRGIAVYSVLMTDFDRTTNKLPNATEPSDHLLIRACVIIPFWRKSHSAPYYRDPNS